MCCSMSSVSVLCGCFNVLSVCILIVCLVFFLMIRRPPRSTQSRSSAASDVYKRQRIPVAGSRIPLLMAWAAKISSSLPSPTMSAATVAVSYTHLRAHETVLDLVCRLLLEKKKKIKSNKVFYDYDNKLIDTQSCTQQRLDKRPRRIV